MLFPLDPIFIPSVQANGASENSITITWTTPPPHLKEHIHYYNLKASHKNENLETMYPAHADSYYAFMNLEPATTYLFKVQACSEYTKQCGNWSSEVNGTTYDGGNFLKIDFNLLFLVNFKILIMMPLFN